MCIDENKLYFSCRNLDRLFCVHENGAMDAAAKIPLGTLAARPYRKGVLITAANGQSLDHLDVNGKVIESFNISHRIETDPGSTPLLNFSRGLCIMDDDLIITAASSTISMYRSGEKEPLTTVNLTMESTGSIDALLPWTL